MSCPQPVRTHKRPSKPFYAITFGQDLIQPVRRNPQSRTDYESEEDFPVKEELEHSHYHSPHRKPFAIDRCHLQGVLTSSPPWCPDLLTSMVS